MKRNLLLATTLLFTSVTMVFAQQVGIGTENPHASAILELESEDKGFLPPRMTEAQRDDITNPSEGLIIYNTNEECLEFFDGTCWICYKRNGTSEDNAATSCKNINDNFPGSPTGVYWLDIDACADTYQPVKAYCDMTTDGGGWTLVLNYNHKAATRPTIKVHTIDFPLLGSTVVGAGEEGTIYWGHAGNSLLNAMTFTEVRFYGDGDYSNASTTGFPNPATRLDKVHFKTHAPDAISYIKTGSGDMTGLNLPANTSTLPGHVSTTMPFSISHYWDDRGNYAMTDWPFYRSGANGWAVRGSDPAQNRWAMGHYMNNNTLEGEPATFHQVWVR